MLTLGHNRLSQCTWNCVQQIKKYKISIIIILINTLLDNELLKNGMQKCTLNYYCVGKARKFCNF